MNELAYVVIVGFLNYKKVFLVSMTKCGNYTLKQYKKRHFKSHQIWICPNQIINVYIRFVKLEYETILYMIVISLGSFVRTELNLRAHAFALIGYCKFETQK